MALDDFISITFDPLKLADFQIKLDAIRNILTGKVKAMNI